MRQFQIHHVVEYPYLVIIHTDTRMTSVLALVHQRQEPDRTQAVMSRRLGELG